METLICGSEHEKLKCFSTLRFLLYVFLSDGLFPYVFSRTHNVPYRKSVSMIWIFSTAFVRKKVSLTHLCMQFVIFQIWLCLERIVIGFLQEMIEENDIFGELYSIIIKRNIH